LNSSSVTLCSQRLRRSNRISKAPLAIAVNFAP
jgi:hypothetical protein